MNLKVCPLDRQLELELKDTGGSAILYLGYVGVNLQIPGINGYNEDVLLLVILTTTYSEKVPVMVGSKNINRAMGVITKGELARATVTWKQAHFSVVLAGSLQLPHKCAREDGGAEKRATPSTVPDPTTPKEFHLDDVQGYLCTTWRVTIPLFETINIHGKTNGWRHCMQAHVLAEAAWGPQLPTSIVPTTMYGELHQGSSPSANLSEEPECPLHSNPHQSSHQKSHSSQPGTTSGPPYGDHGKIHPCPTEGLDPGRVELPGSGGVWRNKIRPGSCW